MMNLFAVLLWSLFISVELELNVLAVGHESHDQVRSRRSVIATAPTERCYVPFFVNKKPPTGFRRNINNVRYICQSLPGTPSHLFFYATMFDLNYGIPIYSAYYVTAAEAGQFGTAKRTGMSFRQEKGIPKNKQGSAKMYRGVRNIHKGHLLAAETFSFNESYLRSTFTYTNAVPQYAAFNTGQWLRYEKRIRQFATNKCSVQNGTLYLLTGISEVSPPRSVNLKLQRIRNKPENIVIPNSMWTAGCCVRPNGGVVGAFGVIGNNVQNTTRINMSQVKVKGLQMFLKNGVIGFGGRSISLFPGSPGCSTSTNNVSV